MMKLTRRICLLGGASALGTATIPVLGSRRSLSTSPISRLASAPATQQSQDLLVVVFLRGGCDGLHLVAPVDDPHYVAARPGYLRVQERGEDTGLPLGNAPADFDFRLHASAPELKELYDNGDLAIIHACGLTNGTRSHFEAQTLMELGVANDKTLKTGWLTRTLATSQAATATRLPAVAINSGVPLSLLGSPTAVAINHLEDFTLPGKAHYAQVLQQLYQGNSAVHQSGARVLDAVGAIHSVATPALWAELENADAYSEEFSEELGHGLRTIATLARLEVGLTTATIDYGDWDTHVEQGWQFYDRVRGLSKSLMGFYEDVRRYRDRVTVLVMTEFGRRLRTNESEGTDHGFGTVMLALGDRVNGGRIYGQWPGLATEQLDRGTDLAITTDFRTVLSEYLMKRTPGVDPATVFPDLAASNALNIFQVF